MWFIFARNNRANVAFALSLISVAASLFQVVSAERQLQSIKNGILADRLNSDCRGVYSSGSEFLLKFRQTVLAGDQDKTKIENSKEKVTNVQKIMLSFPLTSASQEAISNIDNFSIFLLDQKPTYVLAVKEEIVKMTANYQLAQFDVKELREMIKPLEWELLSKRLEELRSECAKIGI